MEAHTDGSAPDSERYALRPSAQEGEWLDARWG